MEFSTPIEGMPWVRPVESHVIAEAIEREGLVGEGKKVDVFVSGDGPGEGLESALKWAGEKEGLVVVCGSLYLVADLFRLMQKDKETGA